MQPNSINPRPQISFAGPLAAGYNAARSAAAESAQPREEKRAGEPRSPLTLLPLLLAGPLAQGELHARSGLDLGGFLRAVEALAEADLVERRDGALQLTAAGRKVAGPA